MLTKCRNHQHFILAVFTVVFNCSEVGNGYGFIFYAVHALLATRLFGMSGNLAGIIQQAIGIAATNAVQFLECIELGKVVAVESDEVGLLTRATGARETCTDSKAVVGFIDLRYDVTIKSI